MYSSPAWQEPTAHRTQSRSGRIDIRDRVKAYLVDEDEGNSDSAKDTEFISPTDAFFARPVRLSDQRQTRQAPVARVNKHRQPHRELEKPQKKQREQPFLSDMQATESPLGKELIDHFLVRSNTLYASAMNNLADMRTSLQKTLIETVSKDDRVLALIDTNHKKIAKPLSETRINNKLVGEEIHVGEHVASFKESIDTVEAEVASLWDQWEIAQNQVDSIFVELASAQDGVSDGGQTCAVAAVKESLAKEMDKLEDELSAILEEAHEEARASEKNFSKKINGVMSALLQQYLLED